MMRRILVAVDGSEPSHRAVEMASELAALYGIPLSIVHVRTDPRRGQVPAAMSVYKDLDRVAPPSVFDQSSSRIADEAASLARRKGAPRVEAIVDTGDPAATIVRLVSETEADMVVLGRRGLGNLASLLLGSVSLRVAQQVECAVLTVR